MRFVPVKSREQQAALSMHRARNLLVKQRTQSVPKLPIPTWSICWPESRCGLRPLRWPTRWHGSSGGHDARRSLPARPRAGTVGIAGRTKFSGEISFRRLRARRAVMAKPVRPGTGTPHGKSKALLPENQNGTRFAEPVRASSQSRLHQQAEQKTAPDQHARSANCACIKGAIHRGPSA